MRLQNLGYAVTAHRAQGITTDTSHVLADLSTTRENLYVAMTRGRHTNLVYVATDRPDPARHRTEGTRPVGQPQPHHEGAHGRATYGGHVNAVFRRHDDRANRPTGAVDRRLAAEHRWRRVVRRST